MKITKLIIISSLFISIFCLFSSSYAYTFGIFTQSKTAQEIIDIESTMVPSRISTIAVVFDNYIDQWHLALNSLVSKLWVERNYHITLSPRSMSAKQVANWDFDEEYAALFYDIKTYNLKVLFRTMHEMNGWWYPRAWDPENFKKARERIWKLSREAWLTNANIQFIFSLNIHDMPALNWYEPSQTAKLLSCTPSRKERLGCLTREDYYPNKEMVDLMGFTAYNWWKAGENRKWLSFASIVNDPSRKQRDRMLSYKKPLYLDEVATTAVYYSDHFDREKSRMSYRNDKTRKSKWLSDLADFVDNSPQIIGMNYFNVDYTNGLREKIIWEADWKILDPAEGMMYDGGRDLLDRNDGLDLENIFVGYRRNENILANKTTKIKKVTKEPLIRRKK